MTFLKEKVYFEDVKHIFTVISDVRIYYVLTFMFRYFTVF